MMPMARPSNTHTHTAPPTESLDSPKKASPIMLLSGSGRGSQSSCLALMWPSESEDESCHVLSPVSPSIRANLGGPVVSDSHEHDTFCVDGPHGKGKISVDKTASVIVCPSGQTVVRVKTSMEARLHSPQKSRWSPSGVKHLKLPSSPDTTLNNRCKPGSARDDSLWHHSRGSGPSSMSFPGRSLLSSVDPSSSPPRQDISSSGDTPLPTASPPVKKKGPRRRKVSGRDKGDKSRLTGGAQGILEQDHPEEDVSSHSRCPCFRFFFLVCLVGVLLAVLFYLSLWLVAQHRGNPVIVSGGETFQTVLQRHLFGQPIVVSLLPQLISGFIAKDSKDKTMVLMFQGQSGTGKTFVAELIQNNMFLESGKPECTGKFLPAYHQVKEHLESVYDYSIALEDSIDQKRVNYRTCPLVFYIIEDLDLTDSLDLLEAVAFTLESIRRRPSPEQKIAFVLMTNIQGEAIGEYFQGQIKNGVNREEITLGELIPILKKFPFSERTSKSVEMNANHRTRSDLEKIHSKLLSVVDHHIPFFPLEREHVIMCIRRTLVSKNVTLTAEDVEWIADKLSYYPQSDPLFSTSGCKKVEEKTNLFAKYSQI